MQFLVILIAVTVTSELSKLICYGGYITDLEIYNSLVKHKDKNIRLNQFNPNIIDLGTLPFISTLPMPTFSKYYINNMGMIPRWSKSHKLIEQCFKEALESL